MRGRALPLVAVLAGGIVACSIAGCGDEDREADSAPVRMLAGPPSLAADSTAVLLGSDTLFTTADLPREAAVPDARFVEILFPPDSTRVAFRTTGSRPAVGVWWRTRQNASVADVFPGGTVDTMGWSPGARFLAFSARPAGEVARIGVYDSRRGLTTRHPVIAWHARHGRATRVRRWVDPARMVVDVGADPDTSAAGHVWELAGGSFVYEPHAESLAENAPPNATLPPGGVFSLDLTGDAREETVALYRDAEGDPGALLLRPGTNGALAEQTIPLVPAGILGWPAWDEVTGNVTLYQVADLGGTDPVLLLRFPSPDPRITITGFFQAGADGRIEPIRVAAPGAEEPALFFEGPLEGRLTRLGLLDLDGDGFEVIVAVATRDPLALPEDVTWLVTVYRYADRRFVPTPSLEDEAREMLDRLATGGADGGADSAAAGGAPPSDP